MSVRVNSAELRAFKEKLGNFDTNGLCEEITKELETRLYRKVTNRTPFDRGVLRYAWIEGKVEKNGNNYSIKIFNPMPYAEYVEYGHRQEPGRYVPAIGKRLKKPWVPGVKMLTISTREIDNIKDELIRQRVEQKFREVL